ncbi:xanthine dehydrogenase family protein subunit M [Rhizobium sp. S96]|uniref:FAD binding domain-containing protein n=1 Tax=Rhizobium sp. S96 TaxID=3055140 RepID=UPI0025AAAC21|nr:xanthine dehydrogenase family protein subunit M [Rhizobium sp. S96]MDM9623052.1 xanthine dehydrogenase family protein subunit M [Rhizobium sp. S96]
MNPFTYQHAADTSAAIKMASSHAAAKYLGGGTNLVDLMRETVERPEVLVDVTGLPGVIEQRPNGPLMIGAAVKNTALATDMYVRSAFPMLSRAILTGASAQIRNMATVGGNILQRTRCRYFYDTAARCNKRDVQSGCDARDGFNRYHAILGASDSCVATHPSDMCVALAALDAMVHLDGPTGARAIPLLDLHRLPGDRPDIETELRANELITAIEIPPLPFAQRSTYRKVRDRASYAFALISVAAALDVDEKGTVRDVRLALGGVAHKPWRAFNAEAALKGRVANEENFRAAAETELAGAVALRDNQFKIELAKRTIVAVLGELKGREA